MHPVGSTSLKDLTMVENQTDWVALARISRVKSYFRTSKTGNRVKVNAYTRSLDKMSFAELQSEYKDLQGSSSPQDRNRSAQIVSHLRKVYNHGPSEDFNPQKAQKARLKDVAETSKANRERMERGAKDEASLPPLNPPKKGVFEDADTQNDLDNQRRFRAVERLQKSLREFESVEEESGDALGPNPTEAALDARDKEVAVSAKKVWNNMLSSEKAEVLDSMESLAKNPPEGRDPETFSHWTEVVKRMRAGNPTARDYLEVAGRIRAIRARNNRALIIDQYNSNPT
jgi:hypothetical protein